MNTRLEDMLFWGVIALYNWLIAEYLKDAIPWLSTVCGILGIIALLIFTFTYWRR